MNTLPDLYGRRHWTANGYHAFPMMANDANVPDHDKWIEFDALLAEAKMGDFQRIPMLAERMHEPGSWALWGQYAQLLGDAGSGKTLEQVLGSIPLGKDITAELYYANTLIYWGKLAVVPTLVDMFERYSFSEDAQYVGFGMSRLLEKESGEVADPPREDAGGAVRDYCRTVRDQYDRLCDELGSDDVTVFRGEVIDIRAICRRMLEDLGGQRRSYEEMRHKFEATTGIDCSGFYQDGELRPLAVAALLEEFLESPAVAGYEAGERYFFGHRIAG